MIYLGAIQITRAIQNNWIYIMSFGCVLHFEGSIQDKFIFPDKFNLKSNYIYSKLGCHIKQISMAGS